MPSAAYRDQEWFEREQVDRCGRVWSLAALTHDAALRAAIGEAISQANQELSTIEQVKRFAIASEPFTIENGEMTPTLKIRRHAILKRYRDTLEDLY